MPTSTEQWQHIQQLFEQALELPVNERTAFLKQSTASAETLKEVKAMLMAHQAEPLNFENQVEKLTQDEPLPDRLGPYKIDRQIGQGGMSVVYLASRDDNTFNRQVAIKTLEHVVSSDAMRNRFRQEQRIHARLNHPNIARLLDAGVTPNKKPYLVMQYVDGLSIIEYAQSNNSDIKQSLKLIIQVCHAIAFAHARLILHRDIKPSNIMVDKQGQVMLLDFGIAKLLGEDQEDIETQQLTREGDKLMTLSYASPEQIRGEELGTASDVFSLGVVLYELLCGQRPFNGQSDYQLAENVLNHDASPPQKTSQDHNISRDIQAICLHAIEKQPQDRYPSIAAFAADIQRFLNHEAILARPPNLFKRLSQFWHRNPITLPLGLLATVGILVSMAAALWQAKQAEEQRIIASDERDRAEQVADLLLDLFDSDPFADNESRRDDITLRAFLTSRSEKMSDQLDQQPALQARLFGLFANLYANLGQLDQAEPMAIKALNNQRKIHGDMHLEVARSANTLATIRQYQARFDEAEQLFKEALKIRTELLPESNPDLANSINNLSSLYFERGLPEDREAMTALDQRTLTIRETYFGKDSLQVAESLNNIAAAMVMQDDSNQLLEAEAMYRRALTIRSEKLGDAHASTGNTMSNLANLLKDVNKLEEAETLFLKAIEVTERALGKQHPRISAPLYGLGNLYKQQLRWTDAVTVHQRSLKINKASLPPDHPYLLEDLSALVDLNIKLNQADVARNYLNQIKLSEFKDESLKIQITIWQQQLLE